MNNSNQFKSNILITRNLQKLHCGCDHQRHENFGGNFFPRDVGGKCGGSIMYQAEKLVIYLKGK